MKKSGLFNRNELMLKPLSERAHDLDLSAIKSLSAHDHPDGRWIKIAGRITDAKNNGSPVIFMFGGHVIRSGMQNYIIDLMEKGLISAIATNGSGLIHDFELALIGATTESVARYIKDGQFGLWKETGRINDIFNDAYCADKTAGMGEAIGKAIHEGKFPNKDISLFARAFRLGIPATVHVGIGYDIIHEHPNCDGAATGALSYNDFLRFASVIQDLEGGVVMNFGSAVMAPEVFLKALSMARNVARQKGEAIRDFTTVVCDLYDLPEDFGSAVDKDNPHYYFRPLKTMLVRTLDGGESFYIKGKHAETIPALWSAINKRDKGKGIRGKG